MAAAALPKAGDVLGGKYKVERVLGTGGMGMVVAARHIELGQRVALKFMLKEAMSDPGNAERFAREARAAVRLQSAHTARVSDVGKLKNGEPYMVMEYLDGNDLDEVLRQTGPMTPHMAVDYILQACEAFAEAHSLGMIHRDIKPKNLFLSKTVDGRGIVKVLDFGLAKTIGAMGDISLTATSAVFGSPQYMSPEQMRSAKDVDSRSDIWSIGVCLYELLTGRVPFDAAGLAEICAMVLKDPVEPPSKWIPMLPPDLDAVIVKCLEKDPQNRYQTVADLAFALEPWAAIEGSARRILHVMQTVQKVEVPTLVNVDALPPPETLGAKTMDAWDSGERTRPNAKKVQHLAYWLVGALGISGLLLILVAVAFGAKSKMNGSAAPASAEITSPSAGVTAVAVPVDPPPPAPREPATPVAVAAPEPVPQPAPPPPSPPVPVTPPKPTSLAGVAVKPAAPKPLAPPPTAKPTTPPKPTPTARPTPTGRHADPSSYP